MELSSVCYNLLNLNMLNFTNLTVELLDTILDTIL